jgi:hypothetical protein
VQSQAFVSERRLLAVSAGGDGVLVQVEVESYCLVCRVVLAPTLPGQSLVSQRQAAFDSQHRDRTPLVGRAGTWQSLGMHHWYALKQYGIKPRRYDRRVVGWAENERRDWMLDRLGLRGQVAVEIADVFNARVVINERIVAKTLQNPTRTPFIALAAHCIRSAIEVWENSDNDKDELRRYYLMPQDSENPDLVGIVAVSAADTVTGEQIVFNVIPVDASYANNVRKGTLRYVSYVENALCVHGCCDANISGFGKIVKLNGEMKTKEQQIAALRKAESGLQTEVQALKSRREKEKAALDEMQAQIAALLAEQEQ